MGFLAIGLEYLILDMYERLGRGPFLTRFFIRVPIRSPRKRFSAADLLFR
jgi:hypothetical protein